MIFTNRFNATYDFEAIDRDFDVFLVENKDYLDNSNILDVPTQVYKARSVQYSFGKKALVLFDKHNELEQPFRTAIQSEHPHATVKKLDIFDEETRAGNFYYQNRLLLLLLVNSMRNPKFDEYSYNNLTGKLFYGNTSWKSRDKVTKRVYSRYFLEISFDPGMYLNLDVKTFRAGVKSKSGRYYLIDPQTGMFRKKLQSDDQTPFQDLFTEASFEGSRNTVAYLNFGSYKQMRKSKLGIMEQFLEDVERYLGQYVTLSKETRDEDFCRKVYVTNDKELIRASHADILKQRGIAIVDECKTDESAYMVNRLVAEFEQHYHITPEVRDECASGYNIRLIHNQEYYESLGKPDPHDDRLDRYIVQHVALEDHDALTEDSSDILSSALKKVLIELILKGDIRDRQVRAYPWEQLNTQKTWTFVQRHRIKAPEVGFERIKNAAGNETKYRFRYTVLSILPDGGMKFSSFDDTGVAVNEFEERIRFVFDTYANKQRRARKDVEGLVFSDIHNIQVIIRTRMKIMPDTATILASLKETDPRETVIRDDVLEGILAYQAGHPEDTERTAALVEEVQKCAPVITKGELKRLMNMQSKFGKRINRFLHSEYDIWVSPELKNKDFAQEYLLKNMVSVRYFTDEDTDGEGITSLNYYAGFSKDNDLKMSLQSAYVVRQVQAEEDVKEFEELLPLMAVDFVRVQHFTVLPFPFKYLREWATMTSAQ